MALIFCACANAMVEEPLEDDVEDGLLKEQSVNDPSPRRPGSSLPRKLLKTVLAAAAVLAAFLLVVVALFITGAVDRYVSSQFTGKMQRMGMSFEADSFDVQMNPLSVRIINGRFSSRESGERLFFIKQADLGLTLRDAWALRFRREITVDSATIDGAEIFITFDGDGRSNFSGVKLVEEDTAVKVSVQSSKLSIKNSSVFFGDRQRKIAAETSSFSISAEPEGGLDGDAINYAFEVRASDASFTYEDRKIDNIDITSDGMVGDKGAEVENLTVSSPAGKAVIAGKIIGWETPEFDLSIESTIDITRTSQVLPLDTPIVGTAIFKGKLAGRGEEIKVEGSVSSDSLKASNVYLKGLDVSAALEGRDGAYEANGKAIAKILTLGDFQLDLPQLAGLIRGSGTDFNWIGELQAAAAKTKSGTIGGLFISDAVAESNERRYASTFGRTLAQYYSLDDLLISDIEVGDLRIEKGGGVTEISAPRAKASRLRTDELQLTDIESDRVDISDRKDKTEIATPRLTAKSGKIGEFYFQNLYSDKVSISSERGTTDITADSLASESVSSRDVRFGKVIARSLKIKDSDDGLTAFSEGMVVAGIETDSAVLGSINVAGARLTIVRGTVEFKSEDFSAGDVRIPANSIFARSGTLERVKVSKPIFILEKSGRYRVTADMTLGGGVIGNLNLGSANASLTAENGIVYLRNIDANLMDGRVSGKAAFALNDSERSNIDLAFKNLDIGKLFALQGGSVMPVSGRTDGKAYLEFGGRSIRRASGTVEADIRGGAASDDGLIPVQGRVRTEGANGLFRVSEGRLETPASKLDVTGLFDLSSDASNLGLRVTSTDAKEIERIARSFDFSEVMRRRIDEYRVELAGAFDFIGGITGNITDPILKAKIFIDSFGVRGTLLGSFKSDVLQTPDVFQLSNGTLRESDGGVLEFSLRSPNFGTNNAAFEGTLTNIDAGSMISILPFDMPKALKRLKADTSGTVRLTGLPDAANGKIDLSSIKGEIGEDTFDKIIARARLDGDIIGVEELSAQMDGGRAKTSGTYDTKTTDFDFSIEGNKAPLARLRTLLPESKYIPRLSGFVDLAGKAKGRRSDTSTYDIKFNGGGKEVSVNSAPVGEIMFSGFTRDKKLSVELENGDASGGQTINLDVDFSESELPFEARSVFNKTPLNPYIAAASAAGGTSITGRATGAVSLKGNLLILGPGNDTSFALNKLKGRADFSQFEIQIDQTALAATEAVAVTLTDEALNFQQMSLSGGGSSLSISGTRALTESVDNNISMVGRLNLALLNVAASDTFFSGFADVNVVLNGPNDTAKLNGRAEMVESSVATFVSSERVYLERLKGTIIFTSSQARIENASGTIGGGKVTISGGALLGEDLQLDAMKLDLRGDNVAVPLPKNFRTTGDAIVSITSRRVNKELISLVSGRINARESQFITNIELADVIGQRRDSKLTPGRGSSGYGNIGLDLIVEGRDALIVRNNLADLTASISLRVTGNIDTPQIAGRITASSGTIFFRYERYEVQRLELIFPPNTTIEPVINLLAEAEIQGYQVIASVSGSLSDMETLTINVRSNPALPQADVVSLVTTGSLANTETGIPTATQSGISAAADILTDEIISKPLSKATDKLFGLNRFEVDPILSGQRLNPSARLTVGRQINKNLLVTYSTNLAQDQNRVLAVEYRLSNRLSVVAQYEQRSLANVTQRSNAFTFEVRVRKRF